MKATIFACCLATALTIQVNAEEGEAIEVVGQQPLEPFTGKVTASRVRMRIKPDLDGHIVKELNEGDFVVVIGEAHDYYAVSPPQGAKAYVYRKYVFENAIEGKHVNVRLLPDIDAPVLGQLNTGDLIEGSPLESGSRWMRIEPPEGVCYFVAKEYVSEFGGPEIVENRERRLSEVGHLMNAAYLTGQSELRKPFDEVDMGKVKEGFEKVISEYSDFPEFVEKAQSVLAMAHDLYLQKKIAFLESKTQESSVAWEQKNAELNSQLEDYQRQIALYQEQLGTATEEEPAPIATVVEQEVVPTLVVDSFDDYAIDYEGMTDRMRVWSPREESLYHLWAMENDDRPMVEFYAEQTWDAEILEGIVESYTRPVMNRPGDFLLRINNRPVAFLYSTKVNLEDKLGQRVKVKAVTRPNNHFAFPAYYVLSVE